MGRTPGSRNYRGREFLEALEDRAFNVPERMIDMFEDPETPVFIKYKLLELMCEYAFNKPAPQKLLVDPSVDDDDHPGIKATQVLKGVPSSILLEMVKNAAGSVSLHAEPK